jgi:hypothetical protein
MLLKRVRAKALADPEYDIIADEEAIPVINALFPDGIGLTYTLRALQDSLKSALEEVPDFEQKARELGSTWSPPSGHQPESDWFRSRAGLGPSDGDDDEDEAELDRKIAAEAARLEAEHPELRADGGLGLEPGEGEGNEMPRT